MNCKHLKLILIAFALVMSIVRADENEKKIKLKDAPAAVQATVKKLLSKGKGKVTEVEKKWGDIVVYEVEIKEGDKEREYIISADGKVLKIEDEDSDDGDDDDDDDDDGDDDDDDDVDDPDVPNDPNLIDEPIDLD